MGIWQIQPDVEQLNRSSQGSLAGHLGIEFLEIGSDFMTGRMPVDERTRQPWGQLHGGSSAAFAETLGSVAGNFVIDPERRFVVGLEINVNHMRPVGEGWVYGTARPFHLGRTTQVWEIHVKDEAERLIAVSRLTLAVRTIPQDVNSPFLANPRVADT